MAWGDAAAEQHEKDQPTEVWIPTPEERKHSDAALVRAYALGHAHARDRVTPIAEDWLLARSWYGEGDEPKAKFLKPRTQFEVLEHLSEIVLDADERRGD